MFKPLTKLEIEGIVTGVAWKASAPNNEPEEVELFVLSNHGSQSFLTRFQVPLNVKGLDALDYKDLNFYDYKVDQVLHQLAVGDSITGREMFFSFGLDRRLKIFTLPALKKNGQDDTAISLDSPTSEVCLQ
jgi:hypothetical protein